MYSTYMYMYVISFTINDSIPVLILHDFSFDNLFLQLRDVLTTWNKFAEICFSRCVSNMNYRSLTEEEVLLNNIL